ncbi:unnamed protein product [Ceratitis capitata]|uniref:(Mediterranean fruit fly) hypothetical protein n=1 Tax=Ceratitis capitata TaxID=7213 RepID=A0A811VMC4_CERCA|nr:unnamed protein product [Ceratitis capitata]
MDFYFCFELSVSGLTGASPVNDLSTLLLLIILIYIIIIRIQRYKKNKNKNKQKKTFFYSTHTENKSYLCPPLAQSAVRSVDGAANAQRRITVNAVNVQKDKPYQKLWYEQRPSRTAVLYARQLTSASRRLQSAVGNRNVGTYSVKQTDAHTNVHIYV